MMEPGVQQEAFEWQVGVWNRMSDVYVREIERRFAPVVEAVIERGSLRTGDVVLDLGTGTGAVADHAAGIVGPSGRVVGVDISPSMLASASRRFASSELFNVSLREGRAESIPAEDRAFDAVLSSLALMYAIDRASAAKEIGRVLRPGGRLVASVWGSPEQCDIVAFQQTAGKFAGPPPASGVGPGALADPGPFLQQLAEAGIEARVETEVLGFEFPNFQSAWTALAGVTTAHLTADQLEAAQREVRDKFYARGDGPRRFDNLTQFIIGRRSPTDP